MECYWIRLEELLFEVFVIPGAVQGAGWKPTYFAHRSSTMATLWPAADDGINLGLHDIERC